MANWGEGCGFFLPRGRGTGWLRPGGTQKGPGEKSLPPAQLGISFPFLPSRELWVLLYNLVRHRLILEPGVFIQDGLDSKTLDVWGP